MTFRVGQKVVCVDDDFEPYLSMDIHQFPICETIYTVRETLCGAAPWMAIRLNEIKNKPGPSQWGEFCEPYFRASRFRPVVERKKQTDISIFKKMLDHTRTTETIAA